MTDDDEKLVKELVSGTLTVLGIITIAFFVIIYFLVSQDTTNSPQSTEVVGHYKECEIVRLSSNNLSEYKYFLYCGENK